MNQIEVFEIIRESGGITIPEIVERVGPAGYVETKRLTKNLESRVQALLNFGMIEVSGKRGRAFVYREVVK